LVAAASAWAALAAGTAMIVAHPGHFTFLPAFSGATFNFFWQWEQLKVIKVQASCHRMRFRRVRGYRTAPALRDSKIAEEKR
jgi:hypothetical protein